MAVASVPRETPTTADWPKFTDVPVDLIDVDDNVRTDVGDVTELAESIKQHGLLQPISVALSEKPDRFSLVVGQRRLAAAKLAGLERIPAIFDPKGGTGSATRGIRQLVENLQRQDLGPLEEARAFRGLLNLDPKLTQAELARRIGRSAPYVSNALRILELDKKVLPLVESGQLSGAHAKALASLKGQPQRDYAAMAVRDGWSAHDLECQVQRLHDLHKREAEELKVLEGWAKVTEQLLLDQGADKKATTLTTVDGYQWSAEKELKALKARGWRTNPASWSRGKQCTCSAYGVGRTWDKTTRLVRRCIDKKHYDEKLKAEGRKETISWEERNRQDAERRATRERLQAAVEPTFAAAFRKLPPNVARILLWSVMDYSLNDWVKEHKGERKKPDAWGALADRTSGELASDLVQFVFRDFGDRYNVKLDFQAIAEAFGVSLDAPTAKAKKAAK